MQDLNVTTGWQLAVLIGLIGGSIFTGYAARRLGFPDALSRKLMYVVVLGPYTLVGFLAIWELELAGRYVLLPMIGFLLMGVGAAVGVMFSRQLGLNRGEAGAFAMACGASNLGFTMGGTVNFVLFGEYGLALASIFTAFWNFGLVFILYPIARHYGTAARQPVWRLLVANFCDIRSLPLLGVASGLVLNLSGISRPEAVERYHLVTAFIIGGVVIAFFTTGLRLHFSGMSGRFQLYGLVAGVKFVLLPVTAGLILIVLELAGWGFPYTANRVVLVQATTAVGVYAVIISNLFHLDDRFASTLFFTNTVFYLIVVLPIVVFLLG